MEEFGMAYESPIMKEMVRIIKLTANAKGDFPILIQGETGTGKELVSRAIWKILQPRLKNQQLSVVDCTAFHDNLIHSELFGHEKGAFTGAVATRIGRFESANNGLIFLDEIGEIPLSLQPKLLRLLETGEYCRVGANQVRETSVRLITATNRDLIKMVEKGEFREDLYYRLSTFIIEVPPLRKRGKDFLLLANKSRPVDCIFDQEAIDTMAEYRWPGNVRELKHVVESASIMATNSVIRGRNLRISNRNLTTAMGKSLPTLNLKELELLAVEEALDAARWVQRDAAVLLGISSRKFNYIIKNSKIRHPSWRRNK